MKAPAFWYKKKSLTASLLSPLGQIYRIAGLLRRARAYPYVSSVPVICVGNIVAGGAGKTPTCLALHKLLAKETPSGKIAFVTRGYGGREKGPLRVDPTRHTAKDVGDEALLLAQTAPCWIGVDRAATIREAEKEATLIIMDDGLQNPHVQPTRTLLVIDGAVGLGNRKLIPAGPLRETLNDAFSRIDGIVMIGEDTHYIAPYLGKPVFQARLIPSLSSSFVASPNVLAFAGIGRPSKFYASCRESGLSLVETQDFADHYAYTDKDLAQLAERAQSRKLQLITTTKDYVRLPQPFREKVGTLEIELVFKETDKVINFARSVSC